MKGNKLVNVLFVCLGNICRSPSAEAVMNSQIVKNNLVGKIKCDSAGTIGHHAGEPADARMRMHASKRGINLTSIARKFIAKDFERFDYIIAMDKQNYKDILSLDAENKYWDKVTMMTDYASDESVNSVPDPYYGGPQGFENVLDILEDSCSGLIKTIGANGFNDEDES